MLGWSMSTISSAFLGGPIFEGPHLPKNTSAASEVGPKSFNVLNGRKKIQVLRPLMRKPLLIGVSRPLMQFSLCEVLYWQDFGVEILKGQAQTKNDFHRKHASSAVNCLRSGLC